jgi:biotin-(acetyl-CoA carboxylase) ligase
VATSDLADRLAGEITRRLLAAVDGSTSPAACLQAYRAHLCYVGKTVLCTRGSEAFEGVVLGVDEGYSLLVSVNGQTLTLSSGEISIRPR